MMNSLPLLILAMIAVESGGDKNAVGDNGDSVGILQIQRKYVADCNRISRMPNRFTLEDRKDPAASVSMAGIYLTYWKRRYEHQTGRPATAEVLARIHNGGPTGWRRKATKPYWEKVKAEMERIRKEGVAQAVRAPAL